MKQLTSASTIGFLRARSRTALALYLGASLSLVACSDDSDPVTETEVDAGGEQDTTSDSTSSTSETDDSDTSNANSTEDTTGADTTGVDTTSDVDPDPATPYASCEEAVASGQDAVIDDFEDGDLTPSEVEGRQSEWVAYDDAGEDGTVTAQVEDGAAHVTGAGAPNWGGFRTSLREEGDATCTYDAAVYRGFSFRAKGSGDVRFKVYSPATVPTDAGGSCVASDAGECWGDHGLEFSLEDDWTEYEVLFSELTQPDWALPVALDPTELVTLMFQLDGQPDFELWVDDVAFVAGDAPVGGDAGPDAGVDPSADDGGVEPTGDDAGVEVDSGDDTDAGVEPVADAGGQSSDADVDASN